jgi:hypothetical protein
METQVVFRNQYRFDLKKVESVLIPYLFVDEKSLIINIEAVSSKKYRSTGRIDQIAIDYPNKLVASTQVVRFGNQLLEFPQYGRFQLLFFPNYYLAKTTITIKKIIEIVPDVNIEPTLQRIENKIDTILESN